MKMDSHVVKGRKARGSALLEILLLPAVIVVVLARLFPRAFQALEHSFWNDGAAEIHTQVGPG